MRDSFLNFIYYLFVVTVSLFILFIICVALYLLLHITFNKDAYCETLRMLYMEAYGHG